MEQLTKALARSPLHHWHAARGAHFVERDGWQIAAYYSDVSRETAAVRAGPGLADLSASSKIEFQGSGVGTLVNALAGRLPRGAVLNSGGVLLCRLTEDRLLQLTFTANAAALRAQTVLRPDAAIVESDLRCARAVFGLVGGAQRVLHHLTAFNVDQDVFPGWCAEINLAGVEALLVCPPEMLVDTALIAMDWDLAEHTWEQLLDAGRAYGISPLGLETWHSLMLGYSCEALTR